jgi:hypothetical protein
MCYEEYVFIFIFRPPSLSRDTCAVNVVNGGCPVRGISAGCPASGLLSSSLLLLVILALAVRLKSFQSQGSECTSSVSQNVMAYSSSSRKTIEKYSIQQNGSRRMASSDVPFQVIHSAT